MDKAGTTSLRIAVVGGGPAGSLFALHALEYAARARREVSITIFEPKDFRQPGRPGCNMCAGIVPTSVLDQFGDLGLTVPPDLILGHVDSYSLHTATCILRAKQPDPRARIITVYRGAGPRYGYPTGSVGFDGLLLDEAVSRGARLRRATVQAIRRSHPVEIVLAGESEHYDLAVLATGVNCDLPTLEGFGYHPPPKRSMCQTELFLGADEVRQRLGTAVHVFLPPNEIAVYGILIPKGPFVTASLLGAHDQMRGMRQFLELPEVTDLVGTEARPVCGCLPQISVGLGRRLADDGFVAVGDASATRLYKNGIGSALATARQAAWTAVYHGCTKADFVRHYVPLCQGIERDNRAGRILFIEVPLLKRLGLMSMAHCHLATDSSHHRPEAELQARILWGMFTGFYSYWELLQMALAPRLVVKLLLALGSSIAAKARHGIWPHAA